MFFRTKFIKGTPLVQLVESFRNAEGSPRQRIVVSLGNANIPENEKSIIAKTLENRISNQLEIIPPNLSPEASSWVSRILALISRPQRQSSTSTQKVDGVLIDQIETENVVQFGPELVALHAWNRLDLTPTLADAGLNPSQIATAQLLVANRLIKPLSEWALIDWSQRTALPELLNTRPTKSAKDRLYLTGDALFSKRKQIEEHFRQREATLFALPRRIVLYDMTNTHFEGTCSKNPKARHGNNKQKRNDCRQVSVGMAFDEYGFALAHEVFEGNISEAKTLSCILDRLSLKIGAEKTLIVLDAGFASKENLSMLQAKGHGYIVNMTRSRREQYAEEFASGGFTAVPGRTEGQAVKVKSIPDPKVPSERLILCRSALRCEKETAMLSKAEERFLKDVEKLRKRIEKGQLKKNSTINRAIGRMQKTHPRVARFYDIAHEKGKFLVERKNDKFEQAEERCGDYVLKTDQTLDAVRIWELYMSLLQAEEGFRLLKGSLGMRPNFHQLEQRVEAHIFITVLAYHLLTWIRRELADCGEVRGWKTLRRILATHSVATTVLPLEDGRVLRIRKATIPDEEQATIYRQLGIEWKTVFTPQKTFSPAA